MESQPVPPVAPTSDKKGLAIASLVIGIVSPCITFVPYIGIVGLIGSILGLIFGILGIKSSLKGLAIAGIVLSSISLAIGIVVVVIIGGLLALGPTIGNVFSKLNSNLASPY